MIIKNYLRNFHPRLPLTLPPITPFALRYAQEMPILRNVSYEIDQLLLSIDRSSDAELDQYEELRQSAFFYIDTLNYALQRIPISGSFFSGGLTARMMALEILRAAFPYPNEPQLVGSSFLRHLMALDYIQILDESQLALFDRAWVIQSQRNRIGILTLRESLAVAALEWDPLVL